VSALPDAVRLFYIGTWQLADDGGWFDWNVSEIGLQLYGYHSRSRRERWVRERGQVLVDTKRLVIHDCGHAFVQNLAKHQKFGGRPVYTTRDAHARRCAPLRADAPHGRERVEVGNGTVGKGITDQNFETALARARAKAAPA
jgi:hypothetical protein